MWNLLLPPLHPPFYSLSPVIIFRFLPLKGQTVEVGNTDAEGRLVLADGQSLLCNMTPIVVVR